MDGSCLIFHVVERSDKLSSSIQAARSVKGLFRCVISLSGIPGAWIALFTLMKCCLRQGDRGYRRLLFCLAASTVEVVLALRWKTRDWHSRPKRLNVSKRELVLPDRKGFNDTYPTPPTIAIESHEVAFNSTKDRDSRIKYWTGMGGGGEREKLTPIIKSSFNPPRPSRGSVYPRKKISAAGA